MKLKKILLSGIGIAMALTLLGCSSGIKEFLNETSTVDMVIIASDNLNPNRKGRSSPVVVYLYEFSDIAPFDQADFFSIYDNEAETIGAVLLAKQELEIRPGEKRKFRRKLKADTRFIGLLAAFRDVDNATWRAAMPIPAHSYVELKLNLDRVTISLTEQ